MRNPIRVLVVDEPAEAQPLVHELRAAGYVSVHCDDVERAARRASTFRPDVVVTELHLAGDQDGARLARQLRAEADALFVFVSRDRGASSLMAAFEAGADDYVVKPYEPGELLARLVAHLRRGGRLSSPVIQVGDLVVDERAHRAAVGDRQVQLGPTDFALLAVLARHAGQVLSKRHLLELVWGYDASEENRVEVHVSLLRRQLGPDAAPLIQTVRGVGYVLRADGSEPQVP